MFRLEISGDIAFIHLDAPPVNAISFASWAQLPELIREAESSPAAVLVFSGLPHRHFCGGNDIREFKDLTVDDTLRGISGVQAAMKAIRNSPMPAIAALHGAVMGSGLILACACDIRLATADTRLALPEVKVNSYGGYALLNELLPRGEARMMTLLGTPISGARAHQLGLVQELADDPAGVLERAVAMATDMAATLGGHLKTQIKSIMTAQEILPTWESYEVEKEFASVIMGKV